MIKVKLICPVCAKNRIIQIEENKVKNNARGIIAINIINDNVCPHNFITYLDKNLDIRDSFITDFTVEIPNIPERDPKEFELSELNKIDISLIKINLLPINFVYILRACFYNKKILILVEEDFLIPILKDFINFIFNSSFDIQLSIEMKNKFKYQKKDFKGFIILDGKNIIKDNQKIFDQKNIKIEKKIVQNFFTDESTNTSLIILRNEVKKAYNLSKSIIKFVKTLSKGEKININKIVGNLQNEYKVTISKEYLNFLIDIVENYFNVKVPIIYNNFLGYV